MTISRFVTLLTPIFAALAGWACEAAARYLPGAPNLNSTELTAVFIAGATFATTQAANWLHNRSKHELVAASQTNGAGERYAAIAEALKQRADRQDDALTDLKADVDKLKPARRRAHKPAPAEKASSAS